MKLLLGKTCECGCGCGQKVNPGNRFINHHNRKGKISPGEGKHHTEETKRIHHFKKYGFKTLIVWERELKDREKLKEKLMSF